MTRLRIHFVCTANICRSAYAGLRAHTILSPHDFTTSSSGLQARAGVPIDAEIAAELTRRGVDPTGQTARRTETTDIHDADLVLTMASWHRGVILENWPEAVVRVFTLPQFVASARAVAPTSGVLATSPAAIITAAYQHRVPAGSVGDVADPYAKGPEAAAACAATLDRLITELDDLLAPMRVPRRAAD